MNNQYVAIDGIHVIKGEKTGHISDIADFDQRREGYGLPNDADSWGWESFCYTERDFFELIYDTCEQTLKASSMDPSEIDAFYLSAASFHHTYNDYSVAIGRILDKLGCSNATLRVVMGPGCATLLSTIQSASDSIKQKRHENILVCTADIVPADGNRFYSYAIIGDAVSSCILSANKSANAWLISDSIVSSPSLMIGGDLGYMSDQKDLYSKATETLFADIDISVDSVAKLFSSNLYEPILRVYANCAGFKPSQYFLDNIRKTAHCYSSDPFINFVDARAKDDFVDGYYVLQSSSMGHVANLLIKTTEGEANA